MADRRAAEASGRRAEALAAFWLRLKLYRVLARRVRTQAGEIDLVARTLSGVVCFVEVKARARQAAAAEALGARQRSRIARAAEAYLAARPSLRHKGVRFDVILVAPGFRPRHLKDAWRPEW